MKAISKTINLLESGDPDKYRGYEVLVYNRRLNKFFKKAEYTLSQKKGKVLVLIHGTFSSTEGSFSKWLSDGTMKRLSDHYEEIIAFDHPTVRAGIDDNYERFSRLIRSNIYLNIDIIGSSRGGWLANHIKRSGHYTVGKVVNIGTGKSYWLKDESVREKKKKLYKIISHLSIPAWMKAAGKVAVFFNSKAIKKLINQPGLKHQSPESPFTAPLRDAIEFRSSYEGIDDFYECGSDIYALAEKLRRDVKRFRVHVLGGRIKIPLKFIVSPYRIPHICQQIMLLDTGYIGGIIFGDKITDLVAEGSKDYIAFHGSLVGKIGNDIVDTLVN